VSPARRLGSRRRATATGAALVVVCAVAGPLVSAPAEAATRAPGGAAPARSHSIGSTATASNPAAVVREGIVRPAAATAGPAAQVGAVIELTPPSGSDRVVSRLAATRGGLSLAQRATALAAAAPPATSEAAAVAWARGLGLTVTQHDRWLVGVSGSAAVMSAAFGTALVPAPSRFASAGPASYLRPATPPTVPVALARVARSVVGLDTRPTYAPRLAVPAALGNFGHTGDQLRDAYGVPRDPAAGAGITVATIQFSGFNSVDFTDYAAQAQIPLFGGQLAAVSVDGANPATVAGTGDVEVDLDTQAILAVAPMARQRVYFTPNTFSGEVDAFGMMADDAQAGRVQVVSSSWGHCESDVSPSELTAVQAAVQRMAAAGATMSASSGDGGSNDCGNSPATNQVDFPTSIPEVVSVGGTSLTAGYQTAWSLDVQGHGSGGGESTLFARPAYQGGSGGRLVPDIALLADPSTGFAVVHNKTFGSVGGTSLASPLFAGLLAGALSEADRTTGVGDIHAALYSAPADAFQDVIVGSNGSYAAGAGFDEVTGLGAPRFGALAEALGIAPVGRTTYHPIDPTRIADTRTGTGAGVPKARLGAGQSLTITVPGSAPGVPTAASGVTAAVVNVTAINPSQSTYLSVYPTGAAGATSTSSVNVVPGTPTPNLVTVKTDASGRISVYNRAGTVDVAVDLAGYYARDAGDLYTPVNPGRILDTRSGTGVAAGRVGPGGTITLHVEGAGGLPASGVDAVTMNVTAVNASASTHVSAFPAGFAGGALSSNLNVAPAKAVANMVITKVSAGGDVQFQNAFGSVDLIADVQGYYATGGGFSLAPVPPVRILDTRPGGLGADSSGAFLVAAAGSRARAVVLNLTGVSPTAATFLSLFPFNVAVAVGRTSSSLNLDAHAVRANLTTTAIAAADPLTEVVYNRAGSIAVLADVAGYFSGQATRLAQTSVTLSAPATAAAGAGVTFSSVATTSGPSVVSLAPGATVTFVEAGVMVLGSGVVAADGTVHLSTSWSAPGTHSVYAVVDAHDGIAGSTSAPVTVTIT
jgi:hypothetical protein